MRLEVDGRAGLGRVTEEGRRVEDEGLREEDALGRDVAPRLEAELLLEAADPVLDVLVLEDAPARWTCVGPLLSAGTLKLSAVIRLININWYFKRDMAFTL